ncbi:unnamed protein product [Coregonus sp. 'balchen']|nr:unnamed protein product [Coregonus sp. 'balchen']
MGDKKSPTRPKRQPKPSSDDGYWDCSVCTFRNTAEAFKCMMCDVRKGTSTRKPRPVSQMVAQQVTPQFASPTQPKKEKKEKSEKEKSEKEPTLKKNSHKKMSVASADQHSPSGNSSSDNTERGVSRSSSPRGEVSSVNGESH